MPAIEPETKSYVAYTVERIRVNAPFDVATAKVVPGDKPMQASKYSLQFKDQSGKVIADF